MYQANHIEFVKFRCATNQEPDNGTAILDIIGLTNRCQFIPWCNVAPCWWGSLQGWSLESKKSPKQERIPIPSVYLKVSKIFTLMMSKSLNCYWSTEGCENFQLNSNTSSHSLIRKHITPIENVKSQTRVGDTRDNNSAERSAGLSQAGWKSLEPTNKVEARLDLKLKFWSFTKLFSISV